MKVGSVYNFSTPVYTTGGPGGCENCRRQEESGALSKSQAHITRSLLREIEDQTKELRSLEPREVEAYLRERLLWKVTGVRLGNQFRPVWRLTHSTAQRK
jgi:hypothetical protein